MVDIEIEKILPHRDRLKLIDGILEADDEKAITVSVVNERWPLYNGNSVNPIILIELIAQTCGIAVGYKKYKETGKGVYGWIVGVKQVDFFIYEIPLGSHLISKATPNYDHGGYIVFTGTVELDGKKISSMEIQLFSPE
jgi:predicted hotdog family 3-hydroxylacyl-ACP dehydratase